MLDDIRNHDPSPTTEEQEWSRTDPIQLVAKALVLAIFAILVGASVSELVTMQVRTTDVALAPQG
ncbi:MAG TPA: hypothetical protein VFE23_08600 [Usitatibacter sp.]|nr:hypothetical protein [Usitatibacter sp.]